jgi:hypothetical protein
MRNPFPLAFVLCSTAGCMSLFTGGTTTRIGTRYPPRDPEAEVQLFSVRTPECQYEEIALVSASVDFLPDRREAAVEALKRRVREAGGDAVVGLTEMRSTKNEGPGVKGTAIRFTDPECRR